MFIHKTFTYIKMNYDASHITQTKYSVSTIYCNIFTKCDILKVQHLVAKQTKCKEEIYERNCTYQEYTRWLCYSVFNTKKRTVFRNNLFLEWSILLHFVGFFHLCFNNAGKQKEFFDLKFLETDSGDNEKEVTYLRTHYSPRALRLRSVMFSSLASLGSKLL